MPPRTLPRSWTLLRPFLDPRSKERFVDLRKARDLDDLGKQKQALLGFPNESIVPPRNDVLPSVVLGTTLQSVPVSISLDYNISYKFATSTGLDIGKNMAGTWLEPAFAPDKGTPQAKLVEPGWV